MCIRDRMQGGLDKIYEWCEKCSLTISSKKTECSFFSRRNIYANFSPSLKINKNSLTVNECPKLLWVYLDKKLRWSQHIQKVAGQSMKRLNAIKAVAGREWGADTTTLRNFYQTFIRSKISYCCEIWGSAAQTHIDKLKIIQSSAIRTCLGCPRTTSVAVSYTHLDVYKRQFHRLPSHFLNVLTPSKFLI